MSVSIAYARDMVAKKSRYKDSPNWNDKVARMPADQVLAIYNRMLHSGEFDKKKVEQLEVKRVGYSQPTLFDFGLKI
ncbi:MAG: hypothetical protein J6Y02_11765 [Pseudobutyrivibrio sp.]|nr:hypothetical protein [Lachnospiraceae bacterium]MBP5596051.1 hypothetical protein [Pseudobutyrivibrio sp.]